MNLENSVKKNLEKIKLSKKERIIVAISGGKDSAVTTYLLKKFGYNIEGLHINLCAGDYSSQSLKSAKKLAEILDIKLQIFDICDSEGKSIEYFWEKNKNLSHCAVCGVFKKWIMNKTARELKFNKIATGHNLDDESLTFFLNILKGAPQLSSNNGIISKNKEGNKKGNFIPRIKPLFYTYEQDILKFARKNNLPFVQGKCPFRDDSYRVEVEEYFKKFSRKQKRNLIDTLEKLSNKLNSLKSLRENYCEICGEVCRGKICKKCNL